MVNVYFSALYDLSQETEVTVTLYSRKVMIMPKATVILPKWLRFVKGKSAATLADLNGISLIDIRRALFAYTHAVHVTTYLGGVIIVAPFISTSF